VWVALCSPEYERWGLFNEGDPMDDATAIDEAASTFMSPRCRVESFFRMKDSVRYVGVDVGVAVIGVAERDFPDG